MRSLWRAFALAWLGGSGSPMLSEEPKLLESRPQERRAPRPRIPPYARPWPGHRIGTTHREAADRRQPTLCRAQRVGRGAR